MELIQGVKPALKAQINDNAVGDPPADGVRRDRHQTTLCDYADAVLLASAAPGAAPQGFLC